MPQAAARVLPESRAIVLVRPRLVVLLGYLVVLCALALFFVWSRLQVVNFEYQIASLGNEVSQLRQEGQALRIEVASLENPSRIERLARTKLGLQRPVAAQIRLIER